MARPERWEVEWWDFTRSAKLRRKKDPDGYEHDRDSDEVAVCRFFDMEDEAREYARHVVETKKTVYGYATLIKQRLEPIEGTLLNDWENVGEPETIE